MEIRRAFLMSKEGNIEYILNKDKCMEGYCKLFDKHEITLGVTNIKDGNYEFIFYQDNKKLYSGNVKAINGVIDTVVNTDRDKIIKYIGDVSHRFKITDNGKVVLEAVSDY